MELSWAKKSVNLNNWITKNYVNIQDNNWKRNRKYLLLIWILDIH